MNKKKLEKARRKIDLIDKKIFNLIVKRTNVVNYMIRIKKFKKNIVDHKRINQILNNVAKKSTKRKHVNKRLEAYLYHPYKLARLISLPMSFYAYFKTLSF